MKFLKKVELLANDLKISIEDVYANDPQFQELITKVEDLLYKFSLKFKLSERQMIDVFVKQIKKGS